MPSTVFRTLRSALRRRAGQPDVELARNSAFFCKGSIWQVLLPLSFPQAIDLLSTYSNPPGDV